MSGGGRSAGAAFSPERHKQDFPALAQSINGHPLCYLDNAATTQKPQCVLEAMTRVYLEACGNVQRGAHTLGDRASRAYEAARVTVQRWIGAAKPEEVVFTSGCTAAINLVARTWGESHVNAGDEVLVTALEHHSNWLPWQELCRRRGAKLVTLPLDARGQIDRAALGELLGPRTRLLALAHVSNTLGGVNPVEELIGAAHRAGARVLVDGAQAVSRCALDVRALDCDFYAFSAHKAYGPFGVGALYAKEELWRAQSPLFFGGGMVDEVDAPCSRFAEPPRRFEAGTPNVAGAVGLARALEYLEGLGIEAIEEHERQLARRARRELAALDGVRVLGDPGASIGLVSFVVAGAHPHDVSTVLDAAGVAVRAGHLCAQPLMRWLEVEAVVRASFALYNTDEDIARLVAGVAQAREMFLG